MDNINSDLIESVQEISLPIKKCIYGIQSTGIYLILLGSMLALTIIGIVIAWIPIWAGISLCTSVPSIKKAHSAGDKKELLLALKKFKNFFSLAGIAATLFTIMITTGLIIALLLPRLNN